MFASVEAWVAGTSFTEQFRDDEVLKRVLDSVRDYAIFTLDPLGVVSTWNEGARRIKGWEADEIIGQHFRVLYIEEDRRWGHPEHNLRKALEDGEYRESHIRQKKDGSHFEADVTISPICDENGVHSGFLKVVQDVGDKRRFERELKESRDTLEERVALRTAQLNHANEELEAFCYSIAHDLRVPIRGIIAKCRIAEEDYGTSLPEEGKAHLDGLVSTAMRLSELVDDLLGFARLGQREVNRKTVDVTTLVRKVADEITPTCHRGTATVLVEEGLTAQADPQLLSMLLHNLLENACKYSEREVRVDVGLRKTDDEWAFYVADNGIGFDMAYAQKLFLPFERLHRDDEIEGTGIGLANVKRIVGRHGGRIWAESAPGEGATFFFTLAPGASDATPTEVRLSPMLA